MNKLNVIALDDSFSWFDAGNADSLYKAAGEVRAAQRSGKMIGCPEEASFRNHWIDIDQLTRLAQDMKSSAYGGYLEGIIEEN